MRGGWGMRGRFPVWGAGGLWSKRGEGFVGVLESPVGRMGCKVPGRLVRLGDPKCAPAAPAMQPPRCRVHGTM